MFCDLLVEVVLRSLQGSMMAQLCMSCALGGSGAEEKAAYEADVRKSAASAYKPLRILLCCRLKALQDLERLLSIADRTPARCLSVAGQPATRLKVTM